MIEEGQIFPEFSLVNEDGVTVTNQDLRGLPAVIYFYPKDDTPGCTTEACNFRDTLPSFDGATVLGVSPDAAKSHRKFIDKFTLNFSLLADTEHKLAEAAGVWVEKSMYGRTYMGIDRTTFVLDADGVVKKVFRKVKPKDHASEVLAALSA